MDNFVDERDLKILENDKYTFFVLRRIMRGKCEFLMTDHERLIICFTSKPFPIWIWTPDDAPKEEMEKAYQIVAEHSFLNGEYRFNLKYDLAKFFIEKAAADGKTLSISVNMFAYDCKNLVEPTKTADGSIHRCNGKDIDELVDFMDLFHREIGIDQRDCDDYRMDAEAFINTGNMFFWKDAQGNNVASCKFAPEGNMASINLVFTRPEYRRKHYAENLVYRVTKLAMDEGYVPMLYTDADYTASNACYEKIGYVLRGSLCTMGYQNQEYILHSAGSERYERQKAINKMIHEISSILSDCEPSIYLYGSSVLDDFRLGWSDIDILVLTNRQISEEQAQKLVNLRQTMLEKEPGNPYYRSFEGGMLTLDALISRTSDRVVYWGTSGERITDAYTFDSFGMAELIESGILLYGRDVRSRLSAPNLSDLYADIKHHYETIRKYVQKTEHSLYSFGWMLDIARCLYTLRTGKIIAKTAAAEWTLENNLCPVPDVLKTALKVRKAPLEYKNDKQALDYAESLVDPIQGFADVLEEEMKRLEYDY